MTTDSHGPSGASVNHEIRALLEAPLPADRIEWRIQNAGSKNGRPWAKVLAYITARGAHERLNDVFGVLNWQITYRFHSWESLAKDRQGNNLTDPEGNFIREPHNGAVAVLKVWSAERSAWIEYEDVCEFTDFEAFKGGVSGAAKRAVVPLGIGAYLYKLGESWADFNEKGKHSVKIDGQWYRWDPPLLPSWALPGGSPAPSPEPKASVPATEQPPLPEGASEVVSDNDWAKVVLHFGKHKGKTLGELPPSYLAWLRGKWLSEKNAAQQAGDKIWPNDLTLMTLFNNLHRKANESQEEEVAAPEPQAEESPFVGDDEQDVPF